MIVMLKGIIEEKLADRCILDVNGVCYGVSCSARTLRLLPDVGSQARLLTEMIVREDSMQLFGFVDELEQLWFRTLTSVQGVGNKVAVAILSIDEPENIHSAIYAGDKAFISRADGVGPKLAARIINELQDKVVKIFSQQLLQQTNGSNINQDNQSLKEQSQVAGNNTQEKQPSNYSISQIKDAISALSNLGYAENDAHSAVQSVINSQEANDNYSVDKIILESLKALAK